MNKRLIYHFYVDPKLETNLAYKIHFYCLEKYAEIFDDAIFIISIDDLDDKEKIVEIKKRLIDCGFKNISFKVEKNTCLYEVETFKKYVLNNMANLDGMTFFAHSKGSLDVKNDKTSLSSTMLWVFGLYYLSLNFYKDAEWAMFSTNGECGFYGGYLYLYKNGSTDNNIHFPKNKAMYCGTFYWMNCQEIDLKYCNNYPKVYNRFYAENFPGQLFHPYNYELYSHNYMMINGDKPDTALYKDNNAIRVTRILLGKDGEFEKFMDEFYDMLDKTGLKEDYEKEYKKYEEIDSNNG